MVARLVRESFTCDAMVLNGAIGRRDCYADQLATMLISKRPGAPPIVVADATWDRGRDRLRHSFRKRCIGAMDGAQLTYCVLSSDEVDRFPQTWGVGMGRVRFTPFYYTFKDADVDAPGSTDGGVFAGGEPLRDYGLLVEAARQVSAPVRLATRQVSPDTHPALPQNVTAGRVQHTEFVELTRSASVVAVPLKTDTERSAGQQTYLNAMAMGKLVVVTDAPGVRDYVEDGQTGLIVPPDASAIANTLSWALDPEHQSEVVTIGQRARDVVRERFTAARYAHDLLAITSAAVDESPASLASGTRPDEREHAS